MQREDVEEAVKTGHKAAQVLTDVLRALATDHYCPEAEGFEGSETFTDCGTCAHCIAKDMLNKEAI